MYNFKQFLPKKFFNLLHAFFVLNLEAFYICLSADLSVLSAFLRKREPLCLCQRFFAGIPPPLPLRSQLGIYMCAACLFG